MNYTTKKLKTTFGPDTRFDVVPEPAAPFRGTHETELERLKGRLLQELLHGAETPSLYAPFRRAANDAAALAWLTPFPLLVFPTLLAESAESARRQALKQARVAHRSRSHLSYLAA